MAITKKELSKLIRESIRAAIHEQIDEGVSYFYLVSDSYDDDSYLAEGDVILSHRDLKDSDLVINAIFNNNDRVEKLIKRYMRDTQGFSDDYEIKFSLFEPKTNEKVFEATKTYLASSFG